MDLYEYQAKEMFAEHGVATQLGVVVEDPKAAGEAAAEIGGTVVVKAQVKTGGRGKAGGVKLASDPADAQAKAEQILGLDIKGHVVHKVLVVGPAPSMRSTTSRSSSTAPTATSLRWRVSRAAWTSRRWPPPSQRPSPRSRSIR